ncbi:MAG: M60 family metallopeptidase [Bacteroidaceae bacterium]|nr:M60 family metallopeptidase [Bacteroidaceae bacterium]
MKRICLTLILALQAFWLVAGVVEDGIYRVNCVGNGLVVTEDVLNGACYLKSYDGDESYNQLWILKNEGGNMYSFQNLLTGKYINPNSSGQFYTGASSGSFTVQKNKVNSNYLDIIKGSSGYWNSQGGTQNLVTWSAYNGTDNDRSAWTVVPVTVDEAKLADVKARYDEMEQAVNNTSAYSAALKKYFEDIECTALKAPYNSMSAEQIRAEVNDIPELLVNYMCKLATDTWDNKWEKPFRISEYRPNGNPSYWANQMGHGAQGVLWNPTGIRADNLDLLYIFIAEDIPSDATVEARVVYGAGDFSTASKTLKKGLNIVPVARDNGLLFLYYIANTTVNGTKVLADWPTLHVNIQGGTLNGYFDSRKHTNADWEDMLKTKGMFSAFAIDVSGEHVLWHMNSSLVRKYVPDHIVESIGVWDSIQVWECRQMGMEDYIPAKHDFYLTCVSVDYNYMFAYGNGTAYNESTLGSILYYKNFSDGRGGWWGPAHEIGHNNQNLITFPGGTEVSNNMFSNICVYSAGRATSRGVGVKKGVCVDFGKTWFERDIWQQTRMYYQLYLYFYEQGHDKEFLPKLFRALRADRLTAHGSSVVYGQDSWLKFALKCCEIANADMSEFFECYGFFNPLDGFFVSDYSNSNVYLTEKVSQQYKEKMQKFEKKLGNLVFVEDRIYPAKGRAPWGDPSVNRVNYDSEWPFGSMGDVGQYLDYNDDVVPQGYTYTQKGLNIVINHENASGAVGFKVYDLEGKLVAISNSYKFSLPASLTGKKVRIVAAAPLGNNDFDIPSSAIAGTEEEQLEALTASLAVAKSYLDMSDESSSVVGWFIGYYLQDLQEIYDQASLAKSNKDQSVYGYGEWSLIVDDAVAELVEKKDARVKLHEENLYALYLCDYPKYSANYLSSGLKANTTDPSTLSSKLWQFVPAGTSNPQQYYIYNPEEDLYITSCEKGKRVKAGSTKQADALVFTLEEYAVGKYSLKEEKSSVYLGYNSSKEVVGSGTQAASLWQLKSVVDNHTEAVGKYADQLLRKASYVLEDVVATYEPLTLCGDIVVRGEGFAENVQKLVEAYQALEAVRDSLPFLIDNCASELETLLEVVSAGYSKKQSLPLLSDEETFVFYFIQNIATGSYCFFDDGTGVYKGNSRYQGNIKTSPLDDIDDSHYWFYFKKGLGESEVYVFNHFANVATSVNSSKYLNLEGELEPVSFKVSVSEDSLGVNFTTDEGVWTIQTTTNGYAQFRTTPSPWRLVKIGEFPVTGIAPIKGEETVSEPADENVYDLFGRVVVHPISGIYIWHGRKVFIR